MIPPMLCSVRCCVVVDKKLPSNDDDQSREGNVKGNWEEEYGRIGGKMCTERDFREEG